MESTMDPTVANHGMLNGATHGKNGPHGIQTLCSPWMHGLYHGSFRGIYLTRSIVVVHDGAPRHGLSRGP